MLYAVLAVISNRYPPVWGRLPTRYSPVRHSVNKNPSENFILFASFDLHVLGTPPAFILSQDQTLKKCVCSKFNINLLAYISLFTVLKDLSIVLWMCPSFRTVLSKNFRGLYLCVSLFSYQGSHLPSKPVARNSLFNISQLFLFVNNFFNFFWSSLSLSVALRDSLFTIS